MWVEVCGKLICLQISSEFSLRSHLFRPVQRSKLCPLMDAILLKRVPGWLHFIATTDDIDPCLHVPEANGLNFSSEDLDATLRASHIITCEYDMNISRWIIRSGRSLRAGSRDSRTGSTFCKGFRGPVRFLFGVSIRRVQVLWG